MKNEGWLWRHQLRTLQLQALATRSLQRCVSWSAHLPLITTLVLFTGALAKEPSPTPGFFCPDTCPRYTWVCLYKIHLNLLWQPQSENNLPIAAEHRHTGTPIRRMTAVFIVFIASMNHTATFDLLCILFLTFKENTLIILIICCCSLGVGLPEKDSYTLSPAHVQLINREEGLLQFFVWIV